MSRIRTSRTRLVGAAATVVLAAFSLTACKDGTGTVEDGAPVPSGSSTSSASASAPTTPKGSTSSTTPTASTDRSGPSEASSSDARPAPEGSTQAAGGADSGKPVTCEGSNTKTVAEPLPRPVNHMLLTVTNTGGKPCYLYGYPAVRFGEAQSVPRADEDSKPQAVVTLKQGESGYASVKLSAADDSGSGGHKVKSLTVYFQGPSGQESVGAGAHPSLPADGTYVDDTLEVTYWQQSMDDAINW
ncbi:DUF4232 domain-containing protein [Streptomyces colonosanans]|uniref:DUF4232 domain-containing protein n=1 Tax=Streptomyces colonosanans TaxID=1428652 RepID=A0A1S2PB57_9ACTN|nr:DUF4232 domain-containing protein [Streptomyces colonosanans]OIJ90973.1 hypothetical protein BIV24_17535 [Streptomyces colonosanans]